MVSVLPLVTVYPDVSMLPATSSVAKNVIVPVPADTTLAFALLTFKLFAGSSPPAFKVKVCVPVPSINTVLPAVPPSHPDPTLPVAPVSSSVPVEFCPSVRVRELDAISVSPEAIVMEAALGLLMVKL